MTNNDRINFRINENAKAMVEALAAAIDEKPGTLVRYMVERSLADLGLPVSDLAGLRFDIPIMGELATLTDEQKEKIKAEVKAAKIKQLT